MSEDERRSLILMALGKASVEFMSQPQGGQIVMPTEALLEVAEDIHAVWALEVDDLAAEVRELRRDKERLDGIFASKNIVIKAFTDDDEDWREIENRDQLDAALEEEARTR